MTRTRRMLETLREYGPTSGPMLALEHGCSRRRAHEAMRSLESQGLVCEAGTEPSVSGCGRRSIVWATVPCDTDTIDVVDWMMDAVIRSDPRSPKHYAEDLGISLLHAGQRIAGACQRGWLDSTLYPTDEGLAARESSMRKSS